MFAAIGDNISLGTDLLSVLWSNSNAKVRFEWRKLTREQRCLSFDPISIDTCLNDTLLGSTCYVFCRCRKAAWLKHASA
jgi:hypothetical protein